jgi:hypothetical protein
MNEIPYCFVYIEVACTWLNIKGIFSVYFPAVYKFKEELIKCKCINLVYHISYKYIYFLKVYAALSCTVLDSKLKSDPLNDFFSDE